MRARYLGDHSSIALFGIQFPKGVFVPVDDAHAKKKIAGNSHFEVENVDAEDVEFTEVIHDEVVPLDAIGLAGDQPINDLKEERIQIRTRRHKK